MPEVYYTGEEGDYNVLVMELLGPNLEQLRSYCEGRFNLRTTLMLADQMICRLENVHNSFYIHRDLKPNNFVIGRGSRINTVYLIDFGLAKQYKNEVTGTHVPFMDKKQIVGTIRFASINAHYGLEQSRRDDLESLCYVLVYLLKGELPWQKLDKLGERENDDQILRCKVNTPIEKLCSGLPCICSVLMLAAFRIYLHKVKEMKFNQKPDYGVLAGLFRELYYRRETQPDVLFCWTKKYVSGLHSVEEGPAETQGEHTGDRGLPHNSRAALSTHQDAPNPREEKPPSHRRALAQSQGRAKAVLQGGEAGGQCAQGGVQEHPHELHYAQEERRCGLGQRKSPRA